MNMPTKSNIVLIGMPAVGKSTIGVLLAKSLSRNFCDTDILIQTREGRRLREIIETEGMDAFCRREEALILSLDCRSSVIATGGSVVYGKQGMEHLRQDGTIILLDLSIELLEERISDMDGRGVVHAPGQSLRAVWEERMPLYRQWADATVDCMRLGHQQVVNAICDLVK